MTKDLSVNLALPTCNW